MDSSSGIPRNDISYPKSEPQVCEEEHSIPATLTRKSVFTMNLRSKKTGERKAVVMKNPYNAYSASTKFIETIISLKEEVDKLCSKVKQYNECLIVNKVPLETLAKEPNLAKTLSYENQDKILYHLIEYNLLIIYEKKYVNFQLLVKKEAFEKILELLDPPFHVNLKVFDALRSLNVSFVSFHEVQKDQTRLFADIKVISDIISNKLHSATSPYKEALYAVQSQNELYEQLFGPTAQTNTLHKIYVSLNAISKHLLSSASIKSNV